MLRQMLLWCYHGRPTRYAFQNVIKTSIQKHWRFYNIIKMLDKKCFAWNIFKMFSKCYMLHQNVLDYKYNIFKTITFAETF